MILFVYTYVKTSIKNDIFEYMICRTDGVSLILVKKKKSFILWHGTTHYKYAYLSGQKVSVCSYSRVCTYWTGLKTSSQKNHAVRCTYFLFFIHLKPSACGTLDPRRTNRRRPKTGSYNGRVVAENGHKSCGGRFICVWPMIYYNRRPLLRREGKRKSNEQKIKQIQRP